MTIRFVVMALFAMAVSGCSDTINGKGVAEPEVARFHEMLKRRDFDGMYASTGEEFKKLAPRKLGVDLFAAIDRKLGQLRKTEQINWHVNTNNGVTTVTLVYDSQFAEGQATETFTFRVHNGKAELVGYTVDSLDMLIK